jgi:hypothetical protein
MPSMQRRHGTQAGDDGGSSGTRCGQTRSVHN